MPIFLGDDERQSVLRAKHDAPFCNVYWAMQRQVETRAQTVDLVGPNDSVQWWHCAAEYVTTAAMLYAIDGSERQGVWLRNVALSIARRPIDDWVGPPFRIRLPGPAVGHLETAHLCWAVGAALDLGAEVFSESERDELRTALRDKGLLLCRHWLNHPTNFNNWRMILNAGRAICAAVLEDTQALRESADEFSRLTQLYQPDGSYGESLQYGNYATLGMVMTAESLIRRDPTYADQLDLTCYAHKVRWDAASFLYSKPLAGAWGSGPRPRSANFHDSAAIYRPSADVLLHIATRLKESLPAQAGLARWLFDTHYLDGLTQGPMDRSSFGFVNHLGFMTLPLLANACLAISPQQAGLGTCETFSCGDVILRDRWDGNTTLAIHGGGDLTRSASHLHGDLNSFILAHRRERMLVDPGHSCYRNMIHEFECATRTHNTCTFHIDPENPKTEIAQYYRHVRTCSDNQVTPPIDRGGNRLIADQLDELRVVGSEIAHAYGDPIQQFSRFWLMCGPHVLFVVDHIVAREPVFTTWHWLLNNRDGELDLKMLPPDRLVVRRPNAAMKLFHLGGANMRGPQLGYVHDAYHPMPSQLGEGKSGSGVLMRWQEKQPALQRCVVHAIAVDELGRIASWHLRNDEQGITLSGPKNQAAWTLKIVDGHALHVCESNKNQTYVVAPQADQNWRVTQV